MKRTDAVARAIDRRVDADEVRQALTDAISPEERDEVLALVRWFTGRYSSPESRLAYVRQAYARWQRGSAEGRMR